MIAFFEPAEVADVLAEQRKRKRSRVTNWTSDEIAIVSKMCRDEIKYHQGVLRRKKTVREIALCRQKISSMQRVLLALANSKRA